MGVRRFARILLVALLVGSTGGILELLCGEPCPLSESASSLPDGACPPTCARCHCARPFDVVVAFEVGAVPVFEREWLSPPPATPQSVAHDIFHVPKPARS
jgi:hypothetical protein